MKEPTINEKLDFLTTHNKNYNKTQYNYICEIQDELKKEKIISIVKNAFSANSKIDIDNDIVSLDSNDIDHIAEQVANDILGD